MPNSVDPDQTSHSVYFTDQSTGRSGSTLLAKIYLSQYLGLLLVHVLDVFILDTSSKCLYADSEGPEQLANLQANQGLHCLPTEIWDAIECFQGGGKP